jgi:hypothetical protein
MRSPRFMPESSISGIVASREAERRQCGRRDSNPQAVSGTGT